jgi:hypothetical protein
MHCTHTIPHTILPQARAKMTSASVVEVHWVPGAGIHASGLSAHNDHLVATSTLYESLMMEYEEARRRRMHAEAFNEAESARIAKMHPL